MKALVAALLGLAVHISGQEIQLQQTAPGLSSPTDIQSAGDGSGRLFIVQQNGVVRIWRNGALAAQPFLDIRAKTRPGGEQGLLGLAFPPGFAQKQRFYVNYTDLNGDTVIAQYRVSSDPDRADASSEAVLFHIAQPFPNHNGGQLRFGPDDFLYIGLGDGGGAGDPFGNGQSLGTLLGKLLRVDVESQPGAVGIPPGNPFANTPGARPEIWAYGLRNPWRFSFDRTTGDLFIADVGQDAREEIDFQPAGSPGGQNYGWNIMEGTACYQAAGCNSQGLTLPVVDYAHDEGCSVTGGFVYRGRVSPGLRGTYLYGDYCSGTVWGLRRQGASWKSVKLLSSGLSITTFGEDEAGEIYVADARAGVIYHVLGPQSPFVSAAGVVNAASFAGGVSPGSAATVFASGVMDDDGITAAASLPLPQIIGGVSVTLDEFTAPLYAVANQNGQEQVNFEVPAGIAGRQTVAVVVTRAGQASAPVSVPVMELQPAIYSSAGSAVVVHNADNTLVTSDRPLVAGEYAYLYAAGLGRVTDAPADGAPASSSPLSSALANVSVLLGGTPCAVQFAGLAPLFAGLYQVNFRVPGGVPSGTQDLVIKAGDIASPPAKVAVQ